MKRPSAGVAVLLALLCASCGGPDARPLTADAHTFRPLGAAADRWLVTASPEADLVAVWCQRAFQRRAAGQWAEIDVATTADFALATTEDVRLATGATVFAAVLPNGLRVAATPAGMVEGESLRGALHPVGLPIVVRAGAINPKQPSQVLLAGDPTGLYRCGPGNTCELVDPSRFLAVRWFDDGTWLLGDADGGVWRHDDDGFHRTSIATEPVRDIDGVPDGGPRIAITASGKVFRSEDHGRSWLASEALSGRVGSGGLIAAVDAAGTLVLGRLDTAPAPVGFDGKLPTDTRLLWASPNALLALQGREVDVIEPRRNLVRPFAVGQGEQVLDARTVGDSIEILVAGAARGASIRRVPAEASLTERALSGGIAGGWPWFLALFLVLGVVGVVVTRGPFRKGRWGS